MEVLSKPTIYAIRALLYLVAKEKENEFVSIRELAANLDLSFHFMTKILQKLTQNGIIQSSRGATGGIILKRSSSSIYIADIVTAIEASEFFEKCILGLPGCGSKKPCPMHAFWKETKSSIREMFESTTLMEMGRQTKMKSLRLVP
jgi:Rrf2 family transcriptional regulator, iron-sulfur cluster assembly transcription factor